MFFSGDGVQFPATFCFFSNWGRRRQLNFSLSIVLKEFKIWPKFFLKHPLSPFFKVVFLFLVSHSMSVIHIELFSKSTKNFALRIKSLYKFYEKFHI